uniref:Uncharacterized protein n=1 Tax=Timema poppense TaxID=170557 RepID=A0A7R9D9H6_TIMPO|nr:unnamed protein product [Timema poppensis]
MTLRTYFPFLDGLNYIAPVIPELFLIWKRYPHFILFLGLTYALTNFEPSPSTAQSTILTRNHQNLFHLIAHPGTLKRLDTTMSLVDIVCDTTMCLVVIVCDTTMCLVVIVCDTTMCLVVIVCDTTMCLVVIVCDTTMCLLVIVCDTTMFQVVIAEDTTMCVVAIASDTTMYVVVIV